MRDHRIIAALWLAGWFLVSYRYWSRRQRRRVPVVRGIPTDVGAPWSRP